MSAEWNWNRLGDHCIKIGSGSTPTGGKDAYLEQWPFMLIRSQNVHNDGFKPSGLAFISKDQAKKLNGVAIEAGDVLLNITGDSVARVCLAISHYLPARVNQHVAIIRPNPSVFDSRFVRYFLASDYQQDLMLSLAAAGATRNALTKSMIEDFKVPSPPIEIQRGIADTLSVLDDRITLLRETNATLEAIAQALFKSWFVDFDPVRAKMEGRLPVGMDEATAALFPDSFEESELGLVPRGWRVARLDEFMELSYGKALKATDRNAGNVPVYGSGGVTGWHNDSLVNGHSVIIGRKGTVGSLYWEDKPFFPIDTTYYVRTSSPMTYCYYLLQTLGLTGMDTDAAVPGLNRSNVYRLLASFPNTAVLGAFDNVTNTIRASIFRHNEQAQTLTILRDTLLPRLISGQLRLPDALKEIEGALP
jgi:type I restriction enzyme S subunit